MKTILILALTPNTPIPAPVSPVVTFGGMERATVHLEGGHALHHGRHPLVVLGAPPGVDRRVLEYVCHRCSPLTYPSSLWSHCTIR